MSGGQPFTITLPPGITGLSPASALAGAGAITLTVTGSNFVSGDSVFWNGNALATNFVSSTTLTATVPPGYLVAPGTASVTVGNGANVTSSAETFTIVEQPAISGLSPSSASAGAKPFVLTVIGSNFVNGSTVLWNGAALPTVFVSPSVLTATVPASDLGQAGTAAVSVNNLGDVSSSATTFTIVGPPAIFVMSQTSARQGSPQFNLTITGTNFVSSSEILWNGTALGTFFVSGGTLEAAVPASLLATPGVATVAVGNPGNVTSPATLFTIIGTGPPQVTKISSGSHSAGGLVSIIVSFNEPMNLASVLNTSAYTVLGGVKKKGRTVYTKTLGFAVTYNLKAMTATIKLSAPYKGGVQVTAKRGLESAGGLATRASTKPTVLS
jgi:hypothetical protein